jgi:hypothetical protein
LQLAKPNPYYVVPNEEWVTTRFLLVLPNIMMANPGQLPVVAALVPQIPRGVFKASEEQ